MRRPLFFGLIVFGLLSAGIFAYLYAVRDSSPVIRCFTPDDNIRPRTYCLLNPFRDTSPEQKAETILKSLREGKTEVLLPFLEELSEDGRNRILGNESHYRIISWRVGARFEVSDDFLLTYWVSRENYWGLEENVSFQIVREADGWKVVSYSAIY